MSATELEQDFVITSNVLYKQLPVELQNCKTVVCIPAVAAVLLSHSMNSRHLSIGLECQDNCSMVYNQCPRLNAIWQYVQEKQ